MRFPDSGSDHPLSSPLSPQALPTSAHTHINAWLYPSLSFHASVPLSLQRGVFGIFLLRVRVRGSCCDPVKCPSWFLNSLTVLLQAEGGQQISLQQLRNSSPVALPTGPPVRPLSYLQPFLGRRLLLCLRSSYRSFKV